MLSQCLCFTLGLLFAGEPSVKVIGPVKVKIQDEKPMFFEPVLPIDPVRRVEYQSQNNMMVRVTVENKSLHLGFLTTFLNVDNQIQFAVLRLEAPNRALPPGPGGKAREGYQSTYSLGKLRVIQAVEVVATKAGEGKQRRRDAVIIHYGVENKDTVPHKIGLKVAMDVFLVDNDGALFAAPNQPGKILDGVVLAGKMVPDYLMLLQRPNLKAPGFVAHLTFALGGALDRPDRVVLTNLAGNFQNNWNPPALPAGGDSALSIFWDPKEVQAGGRRDLAYALGQGIASPLENEGRVKLDLAGSFEPGKLFIISAFISDPVQGQSLSLELPPGIERLRGKEIQPVPAMDPDGNCLVQWRARVLQPGRFPIRVHSSTGATQTKIVEVTLVQK